MSCYKKKTHSTKNLAYMAAFIREIVFLELVGNLFLRILSYQRALYCDAFQRYSNFPKLPHPKKIVLSNKKIFFYYCCSKQMN